MFMSPVLKEKYMQAQKDPEAEVELIVNDLFKSDVYSLGLTLLKAATNMDISHINESEEHIK